MKLAFHNNTFNLHLRMFCLIYVCFVFTLIILECCNCFILEILEFHISAVVHVWKNIGCPKIPYTYIIIFAMEHPPGAFLKQSVLPA